MIEQQREYAAVIERISDLTQFSYLHELTTDEQRELQRLQLRAWDLWSADAVNQRWKGVA